MEVNTDNKVYLGAISGQRQFLQVMLMDGSPAKNVYGLKSGGGTAAEAEQTETIFTTLIKSIEELSARVAALEALRA